MKNGKYEEYGRINWYLNDKLHRVGGPAVEYSDGVEWYLNGLRHREDGPAFEGYTQGHKYKAWWLNGEMHREDSPALIREDGLNRWHLHGKLHCETGPAILDANGLKQWFLNDVELTEEEFNRWYEKKELNKKLQQNLLAKPNIKNKKI
mgnify:CR=1 FL=1